MKGGMLLTHSMLQISHLLRQVCPEHLQVATLEHGRDLCEAKRREGEREERERRKREEKERGVITQATVQLFLDKSLLPRVQ